VVVYEVYSTEGGMDEEVAEHTRINFHLKKSIPLVGPQGSSSKEELF
jgi:hypothetical protein